jgi:hypothetical protein
MIEPPRFYWALQYDVSVGPATTRDRLDRLPDHRTQSLGRRPARIAEVDLVMVAP